MADDRPITDGAFIRCLFPFGDPPEARAQPGPKPHIAYCLGSRSAAGRIVEYMLAYTSSGPWRGPSSTLPAGVIQFDAPQAAKLQQRPFHLDLRCLARVPPLAIWFPAWDEPMRGVVAIADARLQTQILQEATRLMATRPEIVEIRGIGSDTTTIRRL